MAEMVTSTAAPAAPPLRYAPLRAGDPLDIGVRHPAAPPDPNAYDRAAEDAHYARSLLSDEECAELDAELKRDGYLTIQKVRTLIAQNTHKNGFEAVGLHSIDPELMTTIDCRINYKIFVAGDSIYTREELYSNYPFHEFGVHPEAVFEAQEIGIFTTRNINTIKLVARDMNTVELVARDIGGEFARHDLPLRVVKTKFYVGRERWGDFAMTQRVFRGVARVAAAQLSYNGGTTPMLGFMRMFADALPALAAPAAAPSTTPAALPALAAPTVAAPTAAAPTSTAPLS